MKKNENVNTHFAVDKETNKVLYAWDYRGIDPDELKSFKKDYFYVDLKDNEIDPKSVVIVNKNTLNKRNIQFNEQKNEDKNKIKITESELISLIETIIKKKLSNYIK